MFFLKALEPRIYWNLYFFITQWLFSNWKVTCWPNDYFVVNFHAF
jgi:hypothetical protein